MPSDSGKPGFAVISKTIPRTSAILMFRENFKKGSLIFSARSAKFVTEADARSTARIFLPVAAPTGATKLGGILRIPLRPDCTAFCDRHPVRRGRSIST
jgi:hypothetical protein